MSHDQPDVISAQPRVASSLFAWVAAGLLIAALAAAIAAAVYYHGQAVSWQRQLRGTHHRPTVLPAASFPFGLEESSTRVALLTSGPLAGEVTFVAAHSLTERADVTIMARITGGRPHTRYALTGGSCSGGSRPYQWAAGVTDAHGSADLFGPVLPVSMTSTYWLELSPGIRNLYPALAGDFATASGILAYRSGPPMCGT